MTKNIRISYTLEVSERKFEKACKRAMLSKKVMITELRDMAEIHGRVSAYEFIEKITGDK